MMLSDLLIIAIDQAVCAPFATSRLADFGARVIKVERPGGDFARKYDTLIDGQSGAFAWLNRGKESIELDLREVEDRALFLNMIDRADVFIQNLGPGAMERLGLGHETLSSRNPHLVQCSITGYGTEGPYANAKAYDMLLQAEAGLASITGTDSRPGRVGVSIVDLATGMTAMNAIMVALNKRDRTGQGSVINISMFDVVADLMAMPLIQYQHSDVPIKKQGFNHPSIAPYGIYKSKENAEIVIAVQSNHEWRNFCEYVLADASLGVEPDFASNSKRVANRIHMDLLINAKLQTMTEEEIIACLLSAKIAHGKINDVKGLSNHSQLNLQEVEAFGQTLKIPASTSQIDGHRYISRHVPALSEHASQLRKEFSQP